MKPHDRELAKQGNSSPPTGFAAPKQLPHDYVADNLASQRVYNEFDFSTFNNSRFECVEDHANG